MCTEVPMCRYAYTSYFTTTCTRTELVEGTARITEARLKREVGEGKIIDFWRREGGYAVIRLDALNERENKVREYHYTTHQLE